MKVQVHSEAETMALAAFFAEKLKVSDVVSLSGDLGVGKTFFVRSICEKLEVEKNQISSPTFSLIQEYQGKMKIYHCDFYRLKRAEEVEDLGIYDWLGVEGISFLEWADEFSEVLPDEYLQVNISRGADESERLFEFVSVGNEWEERMKAWKMPLF